MRAAILGWALRTPLGDEPGQVLARLVAGERAARENPRFPAASYACRLAATVGSDPRPSRHRKFLRRMGLHAVDCGREALGDATRGDRLGLFFGFGGLRAHWNDFMPALAQQRDDAGEAWARGLKLLHPFWMLHHLSNNAHALLSIEVGARGEGVTYGGSNAGAQAIEGAIAALADGTIDAALVVAYDSLVEPETLVDLGARGAATRAALDELTAPYDDAARGFVPAEAAAALLLARPDHPGARARVSAATSADGAGGEAGARALATAARAAGGAETELVDGAALGRAAADREEREALAELAGADLPLSATLAAMGQVGAAASLVQTIVLAEALRAGVAPPVAGLRAAAPGPLSPSSAPRPLRARRALGVSAGAPGLAGAVAVEIA